MKEFELARECVNGVFKGKIKAAGLVGDNGIGKSHIVKECALHSGKIVNTKGGYKFINGHITTPALVDLLRDLSTFKSNEPKKRTVIIFNDCSILHSSSVIDQAFVKSLLETENEGIASYVTSGRNISIDISCFSFIFTGNDSSIRQSPHLKAIFDRVLTVKLRPTLQEKIELTYRLLIEKESNNIRRIEKEKVISDIIDRLIHTGDQDYSLRTFNKLLSIYDLNPRMLSKAIQCEFKTSYRFDHFRDVFNENSYLTDSEKANQFEKLTGLKRRSYFTYKKRYLLTTQLREAYRTKKCKSAVQYENNASFIDSHQ